MSDCEYCDDDRAYIRPPRKTETFSISYNSSQPKMSYFKKSLSKDSDIIKNERGRHTVYIMSYKTFNELPIDTWGGNRPADELRVQKIHEWMDTTKIVDGTIYLACIDNKLVCYDANHRREAMKGIEFMYDVTVDILWDASEEEVRQEFERININVKLPEVYKKKMSDKDRAEILDIVKQFCIKYKSRLSDCDKPRAPNFNRDQFTQIFTTLCEELEIGPKELMNRIEELNTRLRTTPPTGEKRPSDSVIEKCVKSNLWLFAWKCNQLIAQNLV